MKRLAFANLVCVSALTIGMIAPALAATKAVTIVALPANKNAAVAIELRFRSGAVDDPAGKAGITFLTARLMAEGGTQSLDSKQLLAKLFPMATTIFATIDKQITSFRVTAHRDHLPEIVPILTDVVMHPRWDEKEFARIKDDTINDIEKRLRQGDDENLGKETLGELLYAGHPYGRLTEGHLADLKALTLADVRAHAAKVFTRDRLEIGVAGGYPAELPQQLDKALASLPAVGAKPVKLAAVQTHGPRVRLVDKETESTAVSIGFPWALSHKDPDFVAMTIARSAFGEHRQFNGRLMQRLRGARGLNYGDYAYIEHFEQEGGDGATARTGRARQQQDFTIWLRPVQNENRMFALRAALYELNRSLTTEPFTKDEVESTKGFLDGYVLLFAQTDTRKLGYALDDHFNGTGPFLAEWHKQLATVSVDAVNRAWKKWVTPKRLQIVMVTPGAAALKQEILTNVASPMHYQKDALGNSPPKPEAVLKADAEIQAYPLGATAGDIDVVSVANMFQ